ncbi:MAG: hypothetical protein ACLQGT_14485 [Terracidiphilus sp.]
MKAGSLAVVDTNVLLVANGQHSGVSPGCVIACVEVLEHLRNQGCIVIDDGYEILNEYCQKSKPNTGNRVGDAFLKWLFQNSRNSRRVAHAHIEKHTERGYTEFPNDVELHDFDHADRKFVAVAVAHPKHPPILQGTDSKWTEWSARLSTHRIKVKFLCPADVARFIERKQSRND